MCRCPTPIIFVYIRRNRSHQHKQAAERIIIRTQMVEQKHTHTVQPNLPVFLERASLAVFV